MFPISEKEPNRCFCNGRLLDQKWFGEILKEVVNFPNDETFNKNI